MRTYWNTDNTKYINLHKLYIIINFIHDIPRHPCFINIQQSANQTFPQLSKGKLLIPIRQDILRVLEIKTRK